MDRNAEGASSARVWSRMAAAGWALSAAVGAQAGDVYWSVGVNSPGTGVTVSNAPPVVYAPSPVVVMPAPQVVYPAPPQVIYRPPQVVYAPAPAPVYMVPAPPHSYKEHKHKHKHKHGHHRYEDRHHGWQHHYGPVGHVRYDGGWHR